MRWNPARSFFPRRTWRLPRLASIVSFDLILFRQKNVSSVLLSKTFPGRGFLPSSFLLGLLPLCLPLLQGFSAAPAPVAVPRFWGCVPIKQEAFSTLTMSGKVSEKEMFASSNELGIAWACVCSCLPRLSVAAPNAAWQIHSFLALACPDVFPCLALPSETVPIVATLPPGVQFLPDVGNASSAEPGCFLCLQVSIPQQLLFGTAPMHLGDGLGCTAQNSLLCLQSWHNCEKAPIVCAFSQVSQQSAPLGFAILFQWRNERHALCKSEVRALPSPSRVLQLMTPMPLADFPQSKHPEFGNSASSSSQQSGPPSTRDQSANRMLWFVSQAHQSKFLPFKESQSHRSSLASHASPFGLFLWVSCCLPDFLDSFGSCR